MAFLLPSRALIGAIGALLDPEMPDPDFGGYRGFNNFGDGPLYHLNTAPAPDASKPWMGSSSLLSVFSRLNGPGNTDAIIQAVGASTGYAAGHARSVLLNGVACHLGAVDEIRAMTTKLAPGVAKTDLFKTGGAQAFSSQYWSSTELVAANAININRGSQGGGDIATSKTVLSLTRPILRVPADMPIEPGTYVASEGGWLIGYLTDMSSGVPLTYPIYMADKSTEVSRVWQASTAAMGGNFLLRTNGVLATEANGGSSNQTAHAYCFALVSDNKDDWYLGGVDECLMAVRQNAKLPAAQRLPTASASMWTSTEVAASTAKAINLASGAETTLSKGNSYIVRAFRRGAALAA